MKKTLFLLLVFSIFHRFGNELPAAPLPRLGPADISGTVSDVCWIPETTAKGITGMSGSAGRDRAFSPHFKVKLTDFSGVDAATAVAMTRYVDWNALKKDRDKPKPPFILLKIDYPDKDYLREGMQIKVLAYTVGGDEGGTWSSFSGIQFYDHTPGGDHMRRYLENTLESPGFGGKMFCTYEFYGKEPQGNKQHLYLWAFCMEYYVKQGVLREGTGISLPVVLVTVPSCHGDLIETHFKPLDGEDYGNSIRSLFPPKYLPAIFAPGDAYNRRADTLQKKARQNAGIYYHLK